MLNQIVIMGRLTRDPELRRTSTGIPVAAFSVAVDRDYPNKDTGERETDFIDCAAWRQKGEFISKYFTKGSLIVVSGRLQIRNWEDKDGNKRKSAEIVVENAYFGESKKESQSVQNPEPSTYSGLTGFETTTRCYCGNGIKPAVTDFALLDDDDAQLPF